jgi:hypothetical protein
MTIIFKHKEHTGKIASNRKENGGFTNECAVIVPRVVPLLGKKATEYFTPIIARIYWSKGGTAYACIWINSATKGIYTSGGGKAGGGGYHKASAALQSALDDAGVILPDNIAGRGDSAMTDALTDIALALGYKKFHVHNAHA